MASFIAKAAAKQALKQATPMVKRAQQTIKKEGQKQLGVLQEARRKCQAQLQQCIKTETEKLRRDVGRKAEIVARQMQQGGKRRRKTKRKSRKKSRKTKRKRSRKRRKSRKRR